MHKNYKIIVFILLFIFDVNINFANFKNLDSLFNSSIERIVVKSQDSRFAYNYINSYQNNLDSLVNEQLELAKSVIDTLEAKNKFIDIINPNSLIEFPVGIKKQIGNITYIMGIMKAKINPQYTELTAFVRISLPQTNSQGEQRQLFFGGNNIKLSHEGGIYEDANLVLLGDFPMAIDASGNTLLILKGGMDMNSGDITDKTYVTVDCNGFKELKITADVIFSRSLLEPVDNNYELITDTNVKVKGSFSITASDWNDILATINLPPFQITKQNSSDGKGKGGLVFKLTNAVIDFSDIRNYSNMQFPTGYDQFLVQGNYELWRGVYIEALDVILPKEFAKRNNNERVQFQAGHVLIDNLGFTGEITVDHILPLHEGSASKWQFSVDHFETSILANEITSAAFNGKIVLPTTQEVSQNEANDSIQVKKKSLQYSALLDLNNDEYTLNVTPVDTLSFDVFKAKATILPTSYVELNVVDDKFKPIAVLHGSLDIAANTSNNSNNETVSLNGITFQNLQLQTESPKFSVGSLGYNGNVTLLGLPITISDIQANTNQNTASLQFNIAVNLSDNFSGETTLNVIANYNETNGLQRWQYDHVEVSDIQLNVDLGAVKMNGLISIKEDDPIYGNGFFGNIQATFSKIQLTSSVWFGKTTYRYWYVDAYADFSNLTTKPSIGPIDVTGFGGGAYYHMKKIQGGSSVTPSGLNYQPDNSVGFGFRALMGYAFKNEKAANGKIGFEMEFNSNWGVNRIFFYGTAHIMQVPVNLNDNQFKQKLLTVDNNASQNPNNTNTVEYSKNVYPHDSGSFDTGINAYLGMELDFENDSFHAILETYMNAANGLLRGSNSNNLVGTAILHIDPNTWYLHIGRPDERMGIRVGIGSLSIVAQTYLMIGDGIPGCPPPPQNVADILGIDANDLDAMRDLNALGEGRGFALGMSLDVDTGDMTFLIFYARFNAGVGFDIMVKDYGDAACVGSGQIGVDGWYASGQAYVYLQGNIGIKIKLFGITKKATILSGSAAVLLQAKLPNPSWFRGYVGGDYNVLGIVKGHYNFKVEFGEECELVNGNPLGGLKIISQIAPNDGSEQVDVFTKPQVTFNLNINHPFNFVDDNGDNHTYRIILDELNVTNQGNPVTGHLEWVSDDVVNFVSDEVLPQNDTIHVRAKVIFQEKQGYSWQTIMHNGQPAEEVEEVTFTTGPAPEYIPLSNIEYCYPIINQQYFYRGERNTGYIKLLQGQAYLFQPQTDWQQKVRLINNASGQQIENMQLSYNVNERTVDFELPAMNPQENYTLKIVSLAPDQQSADNQVEFTSQDLDDNNTVEIKNVQAQNVIQDDVETEIISYDFTTSQYNTFADKINAKSLTNGYSYTIYANVESLVAEVSNTEPFSIEELFGNEYTMNQSMIELEAVLDDAYFVSIIEPLVYANYPIEGVIFVDRDTNETGLPPTKVMYMYDLYLDFLENNPNANFIRTRMPFEYYVPYYYYTDFIDIRENFINYFDGNTNILNQYSYLINGNFTRIPQGYYKMRYKYILPGNIQGSSTIFNYYRQ
jgi:hypothetical protein